MTDYTTWAYVEQLLTPFQRNTFTDVKQMTTGAGYRALLWEGMEIYRDKKVTTGYLYMLNTNFLEFYGLNWWEGNKVSPKGKNIEGNVYEDGEYAPGNAFTWTNWIRAYNQGAINGFMIMGGQLISRSPFRNGVLTGITGV
jgi:hypothetical protein